MSRSDEISQEVRDELGEMLRGGALDTTVMQMVRRIAERRAEVDWVVLEKRLVDTVRQWRDEFEEE